MTFEVMFQVSYDISWMRKGKERQSRGEPLRMRHGSDTDILGRTYEYYSAKFAELEGKRAGEFFTPSCVVRTLVEVLQPFKGRVYDMFMQGLIQFNVYLDSLPLAG